MASEARTDDEMSVAAPNDMNVSPETSDTGQVGPNTLEESLEKASYVRYGNGPMPTYIDIPACHTEFAGIVGDHRELSGVIRRVPFANPGNTGVVFYSAARCETGKFLCLHGECGAQISPNNLKKHMGVHRRDDLAAGTMPRGPKVISQTSFALAMKSAPRQYAKSYDGSRTKSKRRRLRQRRELHRSGEYYASAAYARDQATSRFGSDPEEEAGPNAKTSLYDTSGEALVAAAIRKCPHLGVIGFYDDPQAIALAARAPVPPVLLAAQYSGLSHVPAPPSPQEAMRRARETARRRDARARARQRQQQRQQRRRREYQRRARHTHGADSYSVSSVSSGSSFSSSSSASSLGVAASSAGSAGVHAMDTTGVRARRRHAHRSHRRHRGFIHACPIAACRRIFRDRDAFTSHMAQHPPLLSPAARERQRARLAQLVVSGRRAAAAAAVATARKTPPAPMAAPPPRAMAPPPQQYPQQPSAARSIPVQPAPRPTATLQASPGSEAGGMAVPGSRPRTFSASQSPLPRSLSPPPYSVPLKVSASASVSAVPSSSVTRRRGLSVQLPPPFVPAKHNLAPVVLDADDLCSGKASPIVVPQPSPPASGEHLEEVFGPVPS